MTMTTIRYFNFYCSMTFQEMIEKLFSGFNVTVLAYGQTGSGKTHTMGTAFNSETTDGFLEGIIPRAVKVDLIPCPQ